MFRLFKTRGRRSGCIKPSDPFTPARRIIGKRDYSACWKGEGFGSSLFSRYNPEAFRRTTVAKGTPSEGGKTELQPNSKPVGGLWGVRVTLTALRCRGGGNRHLRRSPLLAKKRSAGKKKGNLETKALSHNEILRNGT